MPNRRRFIAAGALSVAALAIAGWWRARPAPTAAGPAISADGQAILRAITPVMLASAMPAAPAERAAALDETLSALQAAVSGLPNAAQAELAQLFALLSLAPVRLGVARIDVPWPQATPAQVSAALDRFRDSPMLLLRAAYDALHQLIFAAWYGSPRSWAAIGYPGPPALA